MDLHARREIGKIADLQEKDRKLARERASETRQTHEKLDLILAHNLLTLHALLEALVKKGIVTRQEILDASEEIDMRDGVKDGQLEPSSTLPEHLQQQHPDSPGEFLRKLGKADLESPRDFLNQLANDLGESV